MNVAKIVHFVMKPQSSEDKTEDVCRAAIITEEGILGDRNTLLTQQIGVAVLHSSSLEFKRSLPYAALPNEGLPTAETWHWSEEHDSSEQEEEAP